MGNRLAQVFPNDPAREDYFERRLDVKMDATLNGRRQLLTLYQEQNGICPICRQENHEIFNKMHDRFKRNKEDSAIADYAELLLGYSLLAEGSEIADLTKFNRLMVDLMVKTL